MSDSDCGCECAGKSTLADVPVGRTATVVGYHSDNRRYLERLLSMGLTKGTRIRLVRVAPMGDPVDIELRGYNLTLRKSEASILQLEMDK